MGTQGCLKNTKGGVRFPDSGFGSIAWCNVSRKKTLSICLLRRFFSSLGRPILLGPLFDRLEHVMFNFNNSTALNRRNSPIGKPLLNKHHVRPMGSQPKAVLEVSTSHFHSIAGLRFVSATGSGSFSSNERINTERISHGRIHGIDKGGDRCRHRRD